MSGQAEPPGGAESPQDDQLGAVAAAESDRGAAGAAKPDAATGAHDTARAAPAGDPAADASDAQDTAPVSEGDGPMASRDPPEAAAGTDGLPGVDAEGDGALPQVAAPDDDGSAEPPDPARLAEGARIAEALIFASDRPVTPTMLGAVLPPGVTAGAVVAALAAACEGRGVTIAEVAGGWAFRTAPDLAQRLTKVVQAPRRLPRAAMEALSIIAYHQPCTRGEIEEIRGAALAQTTLEALLELGLVAPRGRREVPGRPTLWGTTPKFLEQFGLKALSDLPRKEELVTAETGPALPLGGVAQVVPEAEAEAPAPEEAEPTAADSTPGAAP